MCLTVHYVCTLRLIDMFRYMYLKETHKHISDPKYEKNLILQTNVNLGN